MAAHFAPEGWLTVNGGEPAVGRAAIADVARSFMTAFPDMVVTMDELVRTAEAVEFHWTLAGTNLGPGGTGKRVRISGGEEWRLDAAGLVAVSMGRFDAADYARQLAEGVDAIDAADRGRIGAFLDAWHDDAAHSRPAYFDRIAPDGVYIGTDRTERWVREDFRAWAGPHFARPSAWAFTPIVRHIDFTNDRRVAWFDEQLGSAMGVLQASGVLRRRGESFEIAHYQLSVAVPNDVSGDVVETIRAFDSKSS